MSKTIDNELQRRWERKQTRESDRRTAALLEAAQKMHDEPRLLIQIFSDPIPVTVHFKPTDVILSA